MTLARWPNEGQFERIAGFPSGSGKEDDHGGNIGVILTAPTIAFFMVTLGIDWRQTFIYTGLFGVILLVLWRWHYSSPRDTGKVSEGELAWIEQDPPESVEKIGWTRLMGNRSAWAFAVAKFLTDPVWFLMLFWLPKYFASTYNVDLKVVLLPMIIMYLLSDIGSIAGGCPRT